MKILGEGGGGPAVEELAAALVGHQHVEKPIEVHLVQCGRSLAGVLAGCQMREVRAAVIPQPATEA